MGTAFGHGQRMQIASFAVSFAWLETAPSQ